MARQIKHTTTKGNIRDTDFMETWERGWSQILSPISKSLRSESKISMESPYFTLLESRRLPSNQEFGQIKQYLATFHLQEKQVDAEIAIVRGQLDALLEKKNRLTEFIGKHAPLISPIMHIPPDILREIFYRCTPPLISAGWMSPQCCPVLLTHVCSSWRNLALDTPQLWTSLHVYIPPRSDSTYPPFESNRGEYEVAFRQTTGIRFMGTEEWLRRSGGLPLHISINHVESNPSHRMELIADNTISSLFTTAPRWKTLCLRHGSASLFPFLQLPPSTNFVSLESLSITASQGTFHPRGLLDFGNNSVLSVRDPTPIHAPRLRTLALRFGTDLDMYSFPWSQLENLHLFITPGLVSPTSPLRTILSILESCSSLLNLQLHGVHAQSPGGAPATALSQPIITLPRLTTLSVTQFSIMDSHLLPRLNLPRLENLHFECASTGEGHLFRTQYEGIPLYQFIRKANPLHTLAIDPEGLVPSLLEGLLKLCSSLKKLHLTRPGLPYPIQPSPWQSSQAIGTRFLQLLSGQVENETICPELEEFTCHDGITCSESDVLAFLVSKQGGASGVVPLRRLCLRFTVLGPSNPLIFAKIEPFRLEPKIELYFTYGSKPSWQSLLSDSTTIHTNDRAARWFFDCASDRQSTGFGIF